MVKLVQGVGLNDTSDTWADGKKCPIYSRWSDMMKRCYSDKYHVKKPSYRDCFVCDEWLIFSNFKRWMLNQSWEGKVLDKDLLIEGNREYHPDRCVFISNDVNQFLCLGGKENGSKVGVVWVERLSKYKAQVGRKRKNGYIGVFHTEEEAHIAYLKAKSNIAIELAEQQTDNRISEALLKRYVK